jgi:hypothetical protein
MEIAGKMTCLFGLSRILPYQSQVAGGGSKIGALAIPFAGDATCRRTNVLAVGIQDNIILVTAIAAEKVNCFSRVLIFVYLCRRIPAGFIPDRIDPGLNTDRNIVCGIFLFAGIT